jgi:hypothetical protein
MLSFFYETNNPQTKQQQPKMNPNAKSEFIQLEPMYETDDGLEFIVDPNDYKAIQTQISKGTFRMAFHFQTVDGACLYGVTNKNTWLIDLAVYQYLQKNPYDKRILLKLLVLGHFDIGVARIGSYHLIKDVTLYSDETNNEIILHYMALRSEPGNVAWRSITWDLFEAFVDDMNQYHQCSQQRAQTAPQPIAIM